MNLSRSWPFWPLQAAVIDLRFSSSWAHLSSVNAVCSWLLVSTCMSSSLSPLSSISCPKPCTLSVSLTCPASYRSPAASLEPCIWYEAAHPLNCLSSVIYKFINWSCCARRCPLVSSGPRPWRLWIRADRPEALPAAAGLLTEGNDQVKALAAGSSQRLGRACCHLCLFVRLQPWWESPCIPAWSLLCNTVTSFCAYTYL